MDSGSHSTVAITHCARVAIVTIDRPPVNALSHDVRVGLLQAFVSLSTNAGIDGVVLCGTGRTFVAGADVREMDLPVSEPSLPTVIAAMEACEKPIVAAISGAALGGGLELALACDRRLATSNATFGLPETRLGIVPGAGGTQRLPRLVGIAHAVTLIGTAKILKAGDALRAGIVDEIVDGDPVTRAVAIVCETDKRRLSTMPLPPAPADEIEKAATEATRRAKGVPAVAEAVRLVRGTSHRSFAEGLADERTTFLRLRDSREARALRHLFFAEREAAKVPGASTATPRPIDTAAVIGGGTMGSGIAVALASAGIPVTLVEVNEGSAAAANGRVRELYDRQVRSGRLEQSTAALALGRIKPTTDWQSMAASDLVIEAVFEDLALKQNVFRRLDEVVRDDALLATNTSYLDVDAIAGVTRRPQNVLGLHFFAPANVMRLLEIVQAERTVPQMLVSALAFAKRINKLAVVARVCDGFIGNRIFSQYRKHCEYLVEDGAEPEAVDAAAEAMGFALGPFAVSDLSGLDISYAMRKRRAPTRDPRERYVSIADRICEVGRLGRKTGGGWYDYREGSSRGVPSPVVAEIIQAARASKAISPHPINAQEIARRLWAVMANEGAKILAEGISLRASDIDLVLVNGYGLAATTGGPMFVADEIGLNVILQEVEHAAAIGGAGSEPSPYLVELAKQGRKLRNHVGIDRAN